MRIPIVLTNILTAQLKNMKDVSILNEDSDRSNHPSTNKTGERSYVSILNEDSDRSNSKEVSG